MWQTPCRCHPGQRGWQASGGSQGDPCRLKSILPNPARGPNAGGPNAGGPNAGGPTARGPTAWGPKCLEPQRCVLTDFTLLAPCNFKKCFYICEQSYTNYSKDFAYFGANTKNVHCVPVCAHPHPVSFESPRNFSRDKCTMMQWSLWFLKPGFESFSKI